MTEPTPAAYEAALAVSHEAHQQWHRSPNREAYVWTMLQRTSRAIADAVWPLAQQAKAAEILGVVRDQLDRPAGADSRESIVARLEQEMRAKIAQDIIAHADAHAPKGGNLTQRRIRRHLLIAARVAAGPVKPEQLVAEVEKLVAQLASPAPASVHGPDGYRSTACLHAVEPGRSHLHRVCRTDAIRYDGSHKVPAQCKYGDGTNEPCTCPCHSPTGEADDV